MLLELHSCPWISFEVLKLKINNNKSTGRIFKENTLYPPSSVCSSSGLWITEWLCTDAECSSMDGKDAALDSTRTLHWSCRLATVLLVNGPMTVRRRRLIKLKWNHCGVFCRPSEVTCCIGVDWSDLKQNFVFLSALSFRGDPPLCDGSDLKQK